MNKSTFAAMAGIVFESYINIVYGYYAVIIGPLFFPDVAVSSQISFSFVTFAAGFLTRPFGGAVLGYIGDRFGRKVSLKLSIFLASMTTLMIGLTPPFAVIGYASPIILMSCRLLQGLCAGGDYTGAIIYVAEQHGAKNKTLVTCIVVSAGFVGAIIGTAFGAFFSAPFMPEWGWRLNFIVAGLLGFVVYWLRCQMEESSVFTRTMKNTKQQQNPLISAIKENPRQFFASCVFGGANLVPIYIALPYLNSEFKYLLNFSTYSILLNNFSILFVSAFFVLGAAKLISKYSEVFVMEACMLWYIFLSFPMFIWVFNNLSITTLVILQSYIMIGDALLIASLACYLPKLFPVEKRYSGIGLSYSLGQAILGGTTPILAALLVRFFGYHWAPAYLLCIASLLFYIAIAITKNDLYEIEQKPSEI